MRYFIDCEFNEFDDELISIALVGANGTQFYAEFQIEKPYTTWVAANVVPLLDGKFSTREEAHERFKRFMAYDRDPCIVADHPADIMHFCRFIDLDRGKYISPEPGWQFEIIPKLGAGGITSEKPHHALHDAYANRVNYLKKYGSSRV